MLRVKALRNSFVIIIFFHVSCLSWLENSRAKAAPGTLRLVLLLGVFYIHTTCRKSIVSDGPLGSILTKSVFQFFFSIFPKFRYFPKSIFQFFFQYFPEISVFSYRKKHEIPKFRENAEKKQKNSPR